MWLNNQKVQNRGGLMNVIRPTSSLRILMSGSIAFIFMAGLLFPSASFAQNDDKALEDLYLKAVNKGFATVNRFGNIRVFLEGDAEKIGLKASELEDYA
jgi:hypothetical protein